VGDKFQRVFSWTVPVLPQHCGGRVVVPLHMMKIRQERIGRMAYCREDRRSALNQPLDKALAGEEKCWCVTKLGGKSSAHPGVHSGGRSTI
jgi:hypothetical protein